MRETDGQPHRYSGAKKQSTGQEIDKMVRSLVAGYNNLNDDIVDLRGDSQGWLFVRITSVVVSVAQHVVEHIMDGPSIEREEDQLYAFRS